MKILLAALTLLCITACTVVDPGERGVRISLGKVSTEPKPPGAYLWIPGLLGMTVMNVQVQKSEINSTGASKDMQDIHTVIAVNWSLKPENVVKSYQEIGDRRDVEQRIIIPAVNEVIKSATAKLTAEEVLTKRMNLKTDIDNALKVHFDRYGITFTDVSIVNLEFSKEFTAAVERKQIAEQDAKQAEYLVKKATHEADAAIEKAKGQRDAQNLLKQSITPEILQQRAIERWDGALPQVITNGSGPLPFINIKAN